MVLIKIEGGGGGFPRRRRGEGKGRWGNGLWGEGGGELNIFFRARNSHQGIARLAFIGVVFVPSGTRERPSAPR